MLLSASPKTPFLRGVIASIFALGALGGAFAVQVKDISIQYIGAETVDRSVIQSQIRTEVGAELEAEMIEEDIRSLYELTLIHI